MLSTQFWILINKFGNNNYRKGVFFNNIFSNKMAAICILARVQAKLTGKA